MSERLEMVPDLWYYRSRQLQAYQEIRRKAPARKNREYGAVSSFAAVKVPFTGLIGGLMLFYQARHRE